MRADIHRRPSVNHLADTWESIADAIGDAPALAHDSTVRTWSQFDDRSARLAAAFTSLGVGPGTVVAIDLLNCSEYLECYFAALKLRASPANINYRYGGRELSQLLAISHAVVVVVHASLADRVDDAFDASPTVRSVIVVNDAVVNDLVVNDSADGKCPPGWLDYETLVAAHRPAARIKRSVSDIFLSFTGGTTGLPKAVAYQVGLTTVRALGTRPMITGEAFPEDEDPVTAALRLQAEGRGAVALPASPLMHSTALQFASFPALLAGGCVVTDAGPRFDADRVLRAVQRHRVTGIAIVGDAFARPLLTALDAAARAGDPYDCSSVRCIASAGVGWSADVKYGLLRHAPHLTLIEACGTTEGAHYGTEITRLGDSVVGGRFTPWPGIKIVDDELDDVARGEIGRIAAPTVAAGYEGDSDATARTFLTIDGVRFVVPGDLGRIDDDGKLTLLGRGTTVINRGGEKVFPSEVEQVILTHPGVEDVLVFGVADERLGQNVAAIVQVAVGSDVAVDALHLTVSGCLASYKVPRRIVVCDVPRHPNGKPDYATAIDIVVGDDRQS